jgi:hypothetical protein
MTRAIIAVNWRRHEAGTLRGFCDLQLQSGLIFKGCAVHERGGTQWVSLPVRPQLDRDGKALISPKTRKISYSATVQFTDRPTSERFERQALAAIKELLDREPPR